MSTVSLPARSGPAPRIASPAPGEAAGEPGAGKDVLIRSTGLPTGDPGVHALRDVSLDSGQREVVGLLGDNGAGKSTLIKILSGAHRPDAGTIEFLGQTVDIRSPKDAIRLGIETIHQYNSMVPCISIARIIFFDRYPM